MHQHLRAIYEDGVFRPLEPVHIEEHQEVTLVLETTDSRQGNEAASLPIWEFAAELARDVPAEEWSSLPSDGATELDHYLYGTSRTR
ncbi:antitoxin family protein [Lamprobacter sp.]|uniref:antitoxin family protein n=1 Tax=Lamprobacter sp. TaxID=3100796 RepID=UPI003A4D8F05